MIPCDPHERCNPSGNRRDAVAEDVWNALRNDAVDIAYQPVRGVADPAAVLYHECLARCADRAGRPLSPGRFLPILESLGLVGLFDRQMVGRAIALLRRHDGRVLGVNVSAASAVDSPLWEHVFSRLAERPDVAARLIVEITETAAIDPLRSRVFVRRLRQLGCRVAIDDFGAGHSIATAAALGRVDIVKIDGAFIADARDSDASVRRLHEIVEQASAHGDLVVVEGIETAADALAARRASVEWAQGYYYGRPSLPM